MGPVRSNVAPGAQRVRVRWKGTGYRVELVGMGQAAKVALCNSPEELGVILREFGVGQPILWQLFRQLEASADAEVSVNDRHSI